MKKKAKKNNNSTKLRNQVSTITSFLKETEGNCFWMCFTYPASSQKI